jgi:hypothetical protein
MYVRGEAVHALWEIAGSFRKKRESAAWSLLVAGVPTLIALLDDPWCDVRCSAMSLLKELGSAAKSALPRLRGFLTDEKPSVTEHPEGWGLETEIHLMKEGAQQAIAGITGTGSDATP